MQPRFVALPIPSATRSRLSSLCCGIPQVQWVEEENFYLILKHLGFLSDIDVGEVRDALHSLFFHPFSFVLEGVCHSHVKGKRSKIWVGVHENLHLNDLRKEIDRLLKPFADSILAEDRSFSPHVTIGYYDKVNPAKLADYLANFTYFQSEPIAATSCVLLTAIQTPKRMIHKIEEIYSASDKVDE